MMKSLGAILPFILFCFALHGQTQPAENAVLNYRIVGFSVPVIVNANSYQFIVAKGDVRNEDAFIKATIIKHKSSKPADVVELPKWGSRYTWRVVYTDKSGKEISKTSLCHFETGNLAYIDTTKNGLLVLSQAKDHKDLLVLIDRLLVIYDLKGSPIWYMPDIPEIKKRDFNIRDFKATADGTFTFISQEQAIEVDYNGKIVWTAPDNGKVSGRKTEGYHHEFTKLRNGHYLIAGSEIVKKRVPGAVADYFAEGDTTVAKGNDGNYYKSFTSGTLIEYDAAGNVVWSWRSAEHLSDEDFFWKKDKLTKPYDSNPYLNGFDFDEVNNVIYVSYKSINKIVKIAYPGGEVLNSYGQKGDPQEHRNIFYGQHSCRLNRRTNELCVYNNNHSDFIPVSNAQLDDAGLLTSHVVKYKLPPGKNNDLIKNWEVSIRMTDDKNAHQISVRGGSLSILEDDCMLVSTGTLNLLLIIDKQRQKIWEAVPYTTENGQKMPLIPYRSNFIHKNDMMRFAENYAANHSR